MTRPTWNPPPRYSVSGWAEKFRYLSRDYTAQHGRYTLTTVPYAKEPMDSIHDPAVRDVIVKWASQTTKTTMLENVLGYFIAADPSPILMVQPTVEMGQAWSKERWTPTVRDTPVLRDLISEQKGKDTDNTIQYKSFPGGNMAVVGANAPSGLAGRPRRVVLLDEIDRYPRSAGTEGDPCALAERRTDSFWNAVIMKTSTPTIKGFSRIEAEYELSDKREWFCPCPKCGEFQTLKWGQVRWPEGKPAEAWYECAKCEAHLTDIDRVSMVRAGEWRPTAPFTGKRGYFLNGIASPFRASKGYKSRLHQMAKQAIDAKAGGSETLKTWVNTFLGETWDDPTERVEPGSILEHAEDYTPHTIPKGAMLLIASGDVHPDRLEVDVTALGMDDETWGIEHKQIMGNTEYDAPWKDLGNLLSTQYTREDGAPMKIVCMAIDRAHKPKRVRSFIRSCGFPRVWAVAGSTVEQTTLVTHHARKYFHSVATVMAKDIIFARLRIEPKKPGEPNPRFMHFPKGFGFNEEYFLQLTAEVVKTEYKRGFAKRVYHQIRERNEALDLRVYALAAVEILNPNMPALAKQTKPPEPPKEYQLKPPEPPQPHQVARPASPPRPRRNWVNGWR